jgi:hypothetical protein
VEEGVGAGVPLLLVVGVAVPVGEGVGGGVALLEKETLGVAEGERPVDSESVGEAESALLAPTRDRFRAFTRRTFANEPLPKIPVASHNYGGIKETGYWLVDPSTPASVTDRKAYAPYPTTSASTELGSGRAHCPDVPSGTMRWAVLLGQNASSAAGFADVRAQVQMEAATASALVAPTAMTGFSYLGVAQGSALAFNRDSSSARLRVFASQVAGVFSSLNYCLLAAAVWIEE